MKLVSNMIGQMEGDTMHLDAEIEILSLSASWRVHTFCMDALGCKLFTKRATTLDDALRRDARWRQ